MDWDDVIDGDPDEGVTPPRPARDSSWFTGNTSYCKGWWE